jgi:hypothetical protein
MENRLSHERSASNNLEYKPQKSTILSRNFRFCDMLDGRSTVSDKGSYFPFRPEIQGVSEAHPVAYTEDNQLKNSPQCEADH